jgi:hypothetical protein
MKAVNRNPAEDIIVRCMIIAELGSSQPTVPYQVPVRGWGGQKGQPKWPTHFYVGLVPGDIWRQKPKPVVRVGAWSFIRL